MSSSNLEGVDLGEWLKKFPKCYGEGFDYERNAIETAPTPSYSIKTYGLFTTTQRYLLSIIYVPASTSTDMGSKAYGIKHIQASFKSANESMTRNARSVIIVKSNRLYTDRYNKPARKRSQVRKAIRSYVQVNSQRRLPLQPLVTFISIQ